MHNGYTSHTASDIVVTFARIDPFCGEFGTEPVNSRPSLLAPPPGGGPTPAGPIGLTWLTGTLWDMEMSREGMALTGMLRLEILE